MTQITYIAANGSRWTVTPTVMHYGKPTPAGREFWAHCHGESIEGGVVGFYASTLDDIRERLGAMTESQRTILLVERLVSLFADAIQRVEGEFARPINYLEMIAAANLAGRLAPEPQSAQAAAEEPYHAAQRSASEAL